MPVRLGTTASWARITGMLALVSAFSVPPRLYELIDQQGGAFTSQQAYAAGSTVREVQDARERGDLVNLRRGVYAVRSTYDELAPEEQYRVRTHGALLVLKEPVTLSHETAALWCGLELLRAELTTLHVTRPELPASRLEAGIHHHPGALPSAHLATVRGVRVTSAVRTAVDIARSSSFEAGLAAVDSALRGGADKAELVAAIDFCRAWAGARRASRAVAEADGRAANPGESLSRALLVTAGLAPTDLQVEIRDGRGLVGYADFSWLPLKVLGEFDGRGKYGAEAGAAADVVWAEKIREDRLRALGYTVVRWTWSDLLNRGPWLARVRLALTASAARAHLA
jgi:hypothetical protein